MAKNILNVANYSILKRIGTGARSTIYLALDKQTGQHYALKRVIYSQPSDTRIFEQVETEFKVSQQIDNPYVRKCFKLKKLRKMLRVREVLLTMEYFDGKSLEDAPSLSLVDVLVIFRMVASGLHTMHQAGYVHCDMKPNNILINEEGSIKIIDLGQSCRIGTVKKRIQGTPDYIAPEQVDRKPLGPKTDIFNIGATMYWALTGQTVPTKIPKKNNMGMTEPKHARAPHEIRKQVPEAISVLVMDCVRNDPSERPQNMMTIISRLDRIVHELLGDKLKQKNAAQNNRIVR